MGLITYVLLALGALILIGSVGAIYLPAAGIIAAALSLALGYGSWRSDQPQSDNATDSG